MNYYGRSIIRCACLLFLAQPVHKLISIATILLTLLLHCICSAIVQCCNTLKTRILTLLSHCICSAITQFCITLKTRILTLLLHCICSAIALYCNTLKIYFNVIFTMYVQCSIAILQYTRKRLNVHINATTKCYSTILQYIENMYLNVISTLYTVL